MTLCGLICLTLFVWQAMFLSEASAGCRRIQAGIRWEYWTRQYFNLYLFSGDEYIRLSKGNKEEKKAKIRNNWGQAKGHHLPSNLNAAVQWSGWVSLGIHPFYFFKGNDYYRYQGFNSLKPKYHAPKYWNSFFEGGVDAAGNRQQVTHFFKGCDYITWAGLRSGASSPRRIPEGLPCNPDAAWELYNDWETLVIIKDDQIWFWLDEVEGPFPFTDYYDISWKLCPKKA